MNFIYLIYSFVAVLLKLLKPGGAKAISAENILLRQQLATLKRRHKRSPKLTLSLRLIYGLLTTLINPKRLPKIAITIKPSTLLKFHKALVERKYQLLFSNKSKQKPGPKGPCQEIIDLVIEMKKRNPSFGYLRIAMQIKSAFGIDIDKGVVKRILDKYGQFRDGGGGPSWLTFLGHMKDSLWSIDLFRCESILLKSHWVMVVMDQFTRCIIGFSVHPNTVDGIAICCMLNKIISKKSLPHYLSSDNDPLFEFHRWRANLRVLDVEEIKTIPYVPLSHHFIERLIGTIRREYLDKILFWNQQDLEHKLDEFKRYYNDSRAHNSLDSMVPTVNYTNISNKVISIKKYGWKSHCKELFSLPVAA